ncbi:hypothetical protein Tco_0828701 [Tanacetum coccineum]
MKVVTPSEYNITISCFATQIWGCYRLVSEPRLLEIPVVMFFDHLRITYTSVTTILNPAEASVERPLRKIIMMEAFSEVIVLRYDGLPIQPVAPPLPDYIPGLEDPQTPSTSTTRQRMSVRDYVRTKSCFLWTLVPELVYPCVYTIGSRPGYVSESDPKKGIRGVQGMLRQEDGSALVYEIGEWFLLPDLNGDQGVDYGFVSTVDLNDESADIKVILGSQSLPRAPRACLHKTCMIYCEDALDRLSQATHQELQTHHDHVYAHETHLQAHQTQLQLQGTLIQTQHQVHETRFQIQQAEIAALQETDRRRQAQMVETLRVMRDMRREMGDMQTELLALQGQRRARQPAPDVRILDHQDASGDTDSHV